MYEVRVYNNLSDAENKTNLVNSAVKNNQNQAWIMWMKVLEQGHNGIVVEAWKNGVLERRLQRVPSKMEKGWMIKNHINLKAAALKSKMKIKTDASEQDKRVPEQKAEEKPVETKGYKIIVNRNPCQKAEIEDCENL